MANLPLVVRWVKLELALQMETMECMCGTYVLLYYTLV
jgi:hypothetical protein